MDSHSSWNIHNLQTHNKQKRAYRRWSIKPFLQNTYRLFIWTEENLQSYGLPDNYSVKSQEIA